MVENQHSMAYTTMQKKTYAAPLRLTMVAYLLEKMESLLN